MAITKNSVVAFHYTVTDEDGVQMDSSAGNAPLTYLHGASNIIRGLENAMEGKSEGDSFNVTIPPAEAYGEYIAGPVYAIGRELGKLKDGNLMINISLRPKDEFQETSEMINNSIAHLRDRINAIKSVVAGLDDQPSVEKVRELRNLLGALRTGGEEIAVVDSGSGEK